MEVRGVRPFALLYMYGLLHHMAHCAIICYTWMPNCCSTSASSTTRVRSWMVLWRVPSPVPPSTHGLKYSLFYGRSGVREVGYTFSSVEQLMVDFWSDVRAVRGRT